MNRSCSEIESIVFGLYSAEEIKRYAVCKVTSSKLVGPETVYDPRMGILDSDKGKTCVSCGLSFKECPGHFGYIELNEDIIHPLYHKMVVAFLKCFCFQCHRLLFSSEQLTLNGINRYSKYSRFNKVLDLAEKANICYYCNSTQPKIMYVRSEDHFTAQYKSGKSVAKIVLSTEDIKRVFDNIPDEDVVLLGFDPDLTHPKRLILSVLPVLPPCARPCIVAGSTMCDDDLTHQLIEIVKANNHLTEENLPEAKRQKYLTSLKFRIKTLFDNSGKKKAKHTNSRPIKAIKERLVGKDGLIRSNLMGKRVDQSARTVIGPGPYCRIGELEIPIDVAQNLTIPEPVNSFNYEKLQQIVNSNKANFVIRGETRINLKYALFRKGTELLYGDVILRGKQEIKVTTRNFTPHKGDVIRRNGELIQVELPRKKSFRLQIGDIVERQLQNGDIVLLNRYPTLHRGSMLAHTVVVRPYKTFRFSLATTKTFNADFDGDEMDLCV